MWVPEAGVRGGGLFVVLTPGGYGYLKNIFVPKVKNFFNINSKRHTIIVDVQGRVIFWWGRLEK